MVKTKGNSPHWMADPYLAYKSKDQAEAYLNIMKNNEYYGSVHLPFKLLIEKNVDNILSKIGTRGQIQFFDLGPGYPDKSLPIIETLIRNNIDFCYRPYDVNNDFLKIAREAVVRIGGKVQVINGLFEDANEKVKSLKFNENDTSIVFLGLTFMNFASDKIYKIFQGFCAVKPHYLIGARLRKDNELLADLAPAYNNPEADVFAFGPMKLEGYDRLNFDFIVEARAGCLEMIYKVKTEFETNGRIYKVGEKFLTAISYRYTKGEFIDVVNRMFSNPMIEFNSDGSQAFALGKLK